MCISIGEVRVTRNLPCLVATVGFADCVEAARRAQRDGADVIELRIDLFPDPETAAGRQTMLERVKEIKKACSAPLLATVRGRQEGGKYPGDESSRAELYLALLPYAQAVDVEIKAGAVRQAVLPAANRMGAPIILSNHDFEQCPADAAIEALIEEGFRLGAAMVKIAVTPKTQADVVRLLALTERNGGRCITIIGMGEVGRVSRLLFPHFGSRFTYCSATENSVAPGQMGVAEVRAVLDLLTTHP